MSGGRAGQVRGIALKRPPRRSGTPGGCRAARATPARRRRRADRVPRRAPSGRAAERRPGQRPAAAARRCGSRMSAGPTSPRPPRCSARCSKRLGYEPKITVLSVPVTYASMKNKDIDVFLGNWMPTMEADRKPYVEDGSVEVVRRQPRGRQVHPRGARLHLRRGAARLRRHRSASHRARRTPSTASSRATTATGWSSTMIKQNVFGLGSFKLVESSEQGMLAEVERAVRAQAARSCSSAGSRTR